MAAEGAQAGAKAETEAGTLAPFVQSSPRIGMIPNYPRDAEPMDHIDVQDGKVHGIGGGCAIMCMLDDHPDVAVKCAMPLDRCLLDLETEKRVYRHLGKHPHLVNVLHMNDHGIYMEKAAHYCLRLYYRQGNTATLGERVTWCRDVADVVDFIHQKDVRHGDLSGRNVLVTAAKKILLCDFSGSYINGEKATIWAEAGFRHPDKDEYLLPTIRCELHCLGSLLYEIVTYNKPFHHLDDDEVAARIETGEYPDVGEVPLGDVIAKCWQGAFESAGEVAKAVAQSGAPYLGEQ